MFSSSSTSSLLNFSTVSVSEVACGPAVPSPSSDNRVEGVVEPLHRQFHHLSQGVILCAFILIAHRLMRGERVNERAKTTTQQQIHRCVSPHPCFTANVNCLSVDCHRDVFTIIEIHTFLSKHVPADRQMTNKD